MPVSAAELGWLGRVDHWGRSHDWAPDVLLATVALVVLGALSLSGAQGVRWPTGWVPGLIACFAVLHLSVAVRRRAPEVAYLAAALALLVIALAPDGRVTNQVAGGPTHVPALVLPSSLVFLLDLYGVAARLDAVRSRIALAIALVGVAIATGSAADPIGEAVAGGWLVDFYVGLTLAAAVLMTWNLGRLAQLRRRGTISERAEATRLAVLEERARISREMHDIVAHSLAVIVRQAEGGMFAAERRPDRAAEVLQTIADAGRAALDDMRGLLGVLRDPDTDQTAPQPGLSDLAQLVNRVNDAGMDARLVESGEPFPVGAATELAAYRLAQEGLTNAVKHAGPRAHVVVNLCWQAGQLIVDVVDGGGRSASLPGAGAGLQGLRDRVGAVGGTFSTSRVDGGFQVRACFPRSAS